MKIAFLTYTYEPLNSAATNRVKAFMKSLNKEHISCDIYTRYWTGKEKTWVDFKKSTLEQNEVKIVKEKANRIIYVPYTSYKQYKTKILSKSYVIYNWLIGNFGFQNNFYTSKDAIEQEFKNNKYDYIVVSCGTLSLIKLGRYLTDKYNSKLIIDFRDLFNHFTLKKDAQMSGNQKIEIFLVKIFFKNYIKKEDKVFVASNPFIDFLRELNIESELLLNGCNFKLTKASTQDYSDSDKLNISIVGTIYPTQNIKIFINAVKKLPKDCLNQLQLNFIGVNKIKSVGNEFKTLSEFCNVRVTDRIPLNEAIEIGNKSDYLLYMGWKGYKGMYSAKIFDYLGMQRPIILCPSDEDVLEKILKETKAGYCLNDIDSMSDFIVKAIKTKNEKGYIEYEGIYEKLHQYTRAYQNKKLVDYIKKN